MCFEIYQSPNDQKYYWRLWYNQQIIATGHQGHYNRDVCVAEINLVKQTGNTGYCQ